MMNGILYTVTTLLLCYHKIDRITGSCTRAPVITGYSRPYAVALVMTYNLTWQSPACNRASIIQYQIQIVGGCTTGSAKPLTILTGNNKTTTLLITPSCDMGCYLRIRAEMSDTLYTDYSSCAIINNQLMEHEREIKEYYVAVCVPIQGICSSGSAPRFYINGQLTSWPQPGGTLYNITYSRSSESYRFCFYNVTEETVLTEYCHHTHTAECLLCSAASGEVQFLSYSEITNDKSNHSDISHKTITTIMPLNMHPMSTNFTNNLSLFTVVGTVSIGILCLLILMGVLIAFWCYKATNKSCSTNSNKGNIYDEPSLPNPIYQELEGKKNPDTNIELIKNDCYGHVHQTDSGQNSVLNQQQYSSDTKM